MGHVCCRWNHERRQSAWNTWLQGSFLAPAAAEGEMQSAHARLHRHTEQQLPDGCSYDLTSVIIMVTSLPYSMLLHCIRSTPTRTLLQVQGVLLRVFAEPLDSVTWITEVTFPL